MRSPLEGHYQISVLNIRKMCNLVLPNLNPKPNPTRTLSQAADPLHEVEDAVGYANEVRLLPVSCTGYIGDMGDI